MSDREVFEYHGYEEQCKHITGELQELIIAIYKYELCTEKEAVVKAWENMCEELEDVDHMLNQIRENYGINKDKSKHWGNYKRKREHKRIREGYYEKK